MRKTDLEIQRLSKIIGGMQSIASHHELAKQNMRNIRSKLDLQIETFTRIHFFTTMAFQLHTPGELYSTIAEGVVDIFQLELGAIFALSPAGDELRYLGGCNLYECAPLACARQWIARRELWSFKRQNTLWESPVIDGSPFHALDLAHAIYLPIFGNEQKLEGVIIGGITNASKKFYDFSPQEIQSAFMVYGQMMNGIFNNMAAIRQATNADKAKTQFLSNLSHEIRTPMNAIIGMAQIAEHSRDIDEIKKCLGQISASSRHLLSLLNDVLDISKIEEGKFVLSDASFNLPETVESLLAGIRQIAKNKEQELKVNINIQSADVFIGDSLRLSQVLINILSNAVKFTPERGCICLDINELSCDKEKVLIGFSVTDTGIGVSESFLAKLFNPFEQADSSISRHYGGTGLGLAISQRIVKLMGGQINVENRPTGGARFYFSVLLTIDREAYLQDQSAYAGQDSGKFDFSGRRILVVDDVDINREIMCAFLADTGAELTTAANGREAVDMVMASPPYYYDLILMDVQMPVMDGCTAARTIRALDRPDAQTLIIFALTANAFTENIRQVIEAGMNGHIAKPVEYEPVMLTIQKALA